MIGKKREMEGLKFFSFVVNIFEAFQIRHGKVEFEETIYIPEFFCLKIYLTIDDPPVVIIRGEKKKKKGKNLKDLGASSRVSSLGQLMRFLL